MKTLRIMSQLFREKRIAVFIGILFIAVGESLSKSDRKSYRLVAVREIWEENDINANRDTASLELKQSESLNKMRNTEDFTKVPHRPIVVNTWRFTEATKTGKLIHQ